MATVGFERDNAVKHAYSLWLKGKCLHSSVHKNHGHSSSSSSGGGGSSSDGGGGNGTRTVVWAAPERVLGAVSELTSRRREMTRELRASAFRRAGGHVELHYERLQQAPERELSRVLRALGLARGLDAAALSRVSLTKSAAEDLSSVILNFDEIAAALTPWPCLQRMLLSTAPESFDEGCLEGEREMRPGIAWPSPAKSKGDVLRCAATPACTLAVRGGVPQHGGNATSCAEWHRELCAQAMRRARDASTVELCVLPAEGLAEPR